MNEAKILSSDELETIRRDNEASVRGDLHRLLEHISTLESSLETAHKERDQHRRAAEVWRRRIKAAADALGDVLVGKVGRLNLVPRIEEVKRQRDEALQVERAEHREALNALVAAVERDLTLKPASQTSIDARAALSCLTAKAHGYEAIRKILADNYGTDGDPVERAKDLCESEETARRDARLEQDAHHRADLERDMEAARADRAEFERDAAVADNAALVEWIEEWGHAAWCAREHNKAVPCTDRCKATGIVATPHPGAALLDQHRKEIDGWTENVEALKAERDTERRLIMEAQRGHHAALARARNEGLERAARHFDAQARNWASHHAGTIAAQHAESIRAMKEPEQ